MDLDEENAENQRIEYLKSLKHCPDCEAKNIISPVERKEIEEDKCWVICVRANKGRCFFAEEYKGKAPVTKEELILYGLPAELLQHMDLFFDDINKIVRICISEQIKFKISSLEAQGCEFDVESAQRFLQIIQSHRFEHGFHSAGVIKYSESQPPADENKTNVGQVNECVSGTENDNVDGPLGHRFGQHSNTSSLEQNMKTEQELASNSADFQCSSLSDHPKPAVDKSTLWKHLSGTNLWDPYRKLAECYVEDLPMDYRDKVLTAFSKIEGYKFPEDFAISSSSDNLPLTNFVKEQDRHVMVQSEIDEQLSNFNFASSLYDFKHIL